MGGFFDKGEALWWKSGGGFLKERLLLKGRGQTRKGTGVMRTVLTIKEGQLTYSRKRLEKESQKRQGKGGQKEKSKGRGGMYRNNHPKG